MKIIYSIRKTIENGNNQLEETIKDIEMIDGDSITASNGKTFWYGGKNCWPDRQINTINDDGTILKTIIFHQSSN